MLRRVLKDSVLYGVSGAASRFVGVLLVPLYTRAFSPVEYGLLDVIATISTVLMLLSGMQVESGVARSYYEAKEQGRKSQLVGTGVWLYVAGALFWSAVAAIVFQTGFRGYRGLSWEVAIPALAVILPSQLMTLGMLIMRFERRAGLYGLIAIGDVLSSSLMSVAAIYLLHAGISGMLWSLALSKMIWCCVSCLTLRDSLRFTPTRAECREILSYGVPLVPAVLVSWAQGYANRFLMISDLTLTDIGIYSLAMKIASGISIVDTAFRLSWDPYAISIMGNPDARFRYASMLNFYVLGMFAVCALAGALGALAVRLLATEAYAGAGRLVGFLAMSQLWSGILQILLIGIGVVRKTYLGAIAFTLGVAANLGILALTIRHHGVLAVCYSYLCGSLITALLVLYIAQRNYHVPYRYLTLALALVMSVLLSLYFHAAAPAADLQTLCLDTGYRLGVALLACVLMSVVVIQRREWQKLWEQGSSLLATLMANRTS